MNTSLKTSLAAAASAALLGATATASAAEYANVVSATPVTSSVAVPRQDCVQSERARPGAAVGRRRADRRDRRRRHRQPVRPRLRPRRRDRRRRRRRRGDRQQRRGERQPAGSRCRCSAAAPSTRYENRVVGYDVVYEYHGQRYTTRLPSDPGPRLAIDMRPTAGAPLDRVAPAGELRRRPAGSRMPQRRAELQRSAAGVDDAAPATTTPAPVVLRAGAGLLLAPYAAPYYVAPAAIGFGIGYWVGSTWHRGYRHGWHGDRGWR